jgi:hypothetical protein
MSVDLNGLGVSSAEASWVAADEARVGFKTVSEGTIDVDAKWHRLPASVSRVKVLPTPTGKSAHRRSADPWSSYLSRLDASDVGLTPAHAGAVRAVWQDLLDRVGPGLRHPVAEPGGDLGFHFAWAGPDFYLSIDIASDRRLEWFWKDRRTGRSEGDGDDATLTAAPEMLIRKLVAHCLS